MLTDFIYHIYVRVGDGCFSWVVMNMGDMDSFLASVSHSLQCVKGCFHGVNRLRHGPNLARAWCYHTVLVFIMLTCGSALADTTHNQLGMT